MLGSIIELIKTDELINDYYTPFIKSKYDNKQIDYDKQIKDLEKERDNIKVEVKLLENKNKQLQQNYNNLFDLFKTILQTLKKFFKRLLKIGTEKDKDDVVSEIKDYHKQDLYDNFDLHDIANGTSREEEINDYLYTKNYEYDDRDFDI